MADDDLDLDAPAMTKRGTLSRLRADVFRDTTFDNLRTNWALEFSTIYGADPGVFLIEKFRSRDEALTYLDQCPFDQCEHVVLVGATYSGSRGEVIAVYENHGRKRETWTSTAFHGAQHEPAAGSPHRANGEIND